MAGHSCNTETIKLKEKIDFDNLVQSQPLIKLMDQIGFSFSPSIHDLLSLSRSTSSISCPSFEELLCPSSVSVLLGFLSFFFFEGGSFTAILNFCSCNFITGPPYASSGRGKAYMGLKVVSQVM